MQHETLIRELQKMGPWQAQLDSVNLMLKVCLDECVSVVQMLGDGVGNIAANVAARDGSTSARRHYTETHRITEGAVPALPSVPEDRISMQATGSHRGVREAVCRLEQHGRRLADNLDSMSSSAPAIHSTVPALPDQQSFTSAIHSPFHRQLVVQVNTIQASLEKQGQWIEELFAVFSSQQEKEHRLMEGITKMLDSTQDSVRYLQHSSHKADSRLGGLETLIGKMQEQEHGLVRGMLEAAQETGEMVAQIARLKEVLTKQESQLHDVTGGLTELKARIPAT